MATSVDIKYYNTYILKKIADTTTYGTSYNWYIEESRIRGGYNNVSTGLAPRAFIEAESNLQQSLGNSLIYSGVFNSRTGINQTNVFNAGKDITKSVDPSKGTIQKLHAEDTNLIIFQERKVNRALIDKDAIYTAEGSPIQTTSNVVIGQISSYSGEFGISTNPESFAVYGYRKYFTDAEKGSVMRLSRDGLTEISNYGMYDFFRDHLSNLGNGKIIGGWDIHNKCYTVSIQPQAAFSDGSTYKTLNFDEQVLGWTSLFSYKPDDMFSLGNNFYSTTSGHSDTKDGTIYQHYVTQDDAGSPIPRATFYGTTSNSNITTVFNIQPSSVKRFKTINYEGGPNWTLESFITNEDTANAVAKYSVPTTLADMEASLLANKFKAKEDKYFANLINTSAATSGEVIYGKSISGIKGFYAIAKLSVVNDASSGTNELFATSTDFTESSY